MPEVKTGTSNTPQNEQINQEQNSGNINAGTPNGDAGSATTPTPNQPVAGTDPEKASGNNADTKTTSTATPTGGTSVRIVSAEEKEREKLPLTSTTEAVSNANNYRAKVLAFLDALNNGTEAEKRQSSEGIKNVEAAAASLAESVKAAGGNEKADIATHPLGFDNRATYKEKRAAVIGNINHTVTELQSLSDKRYDDKVGAGYLSNVGSAVDSLKAASVALSKL